MANGYDAHSLKMSGLTEAASSDMPMSQMMPVAVRDKRFTRSGIGYRTQQEADYPGGTATQKRGMDESQRPWETAQEATSPQIKPRDTLERSGLLENGDGWDTGFPDEEDAREALGTLSQFVDAATLQKVRDAIVKQFGDPADRPAPPPEPMDWEDPEDGGYMPLGMMGESDLEEAPLNAQKRNKLPDSAFALPGRKYPIDTPERARSALARVEQFGSDSDKARVRAAVKKKYPNMKVE